MFKVIAGLIALAGVALATPALAQSIYLGNSGVSVGVGERGYRGYDYDRPRYRSYGAYRDSYAYGGRRQYQCPRGYTIQHGRCEPYRGR